MYTVAPKSKDGYEAAVIWNNVEFMCKLISSCSVFTAETTAVHTPSSPQTPSVSSIISIIHITNQILTHTFKTKLTRYKKTIITKSNCFGFLETSTYYKISSPTSQSKPQPPLHYTNHTNIFIQILIINKFKRR